MVEGVKGGESRGGVGTWMMGNGGAAEAKGAVTPGIAGMIPPGILSPKGLPLVKDARAAARATDLYNIAIGEQLSKLMN
jgi:hypothetical protein